MARRLTPLGVLAMGLFLRFIFTLRPELRSREWAIDGFRPPPRWD